MAHLITRRSFLKLAALSLGSLAFTPFTGTTGELDTGDLGRVTVYSVSVYEKPDDKSRILCQRYRDELVNIYQEVISPAGPVYNPKWYRVWRGYIHSAFIQRVSFRLNTAVGTIAKTGQIAEVTVPFTQSYRLKYKKEWELLYRLYFGSNHWIMSIDEGPDQHAWYRLRDELNGAEYFVPAEHLRIISPEEMAPISPDVPAHLKRIDISLGQQLVTAYEEDRVVMQVKISSGEPSLNPTNKGIPTNTPTGTFHIQNKMPSKHMGDGNLTSDVEAYELPGVPWVCFFEPKTGVALHGTYWHDNFGIQMSHGCVNMRNDDAKWLYRWANPQIEIHEWTQPGYGTRVEVS
jgi:hypothetical protein